MAGKRGGGGIWKGEFGMLRFERLQFAEQPVVFRIGNERRIQHIIGMVVPLDLGAQDCDTMCYGRIHLGKINQLATEITEKNKVAQCEQAYLDIRKE